LQALMDEAGLDARITDLAWSSRVRVQHRVADRFGRGRLFLAGDAAHAYSPATGQGMNAAIQDAANLGWKLAFAAPRPGHGPLLDSYDLERRPVARQVLAMTHLAFWAEASTGGVPSALRGRLAPLAAPLVPALTGRRRLVAEAIRLVSQLRVSYRRSPLSVEGTPRRRGGPRAGDRLPDQLVSSAGRSIRLHDLIARPGVHVLLDRDADLIGTLHPGRSVHIHRLSSSPGHGLIGVRPDGYIGFRGQIADVSQLTAWLARLRAGDVQGSARARRSARSLMPSSILRSITRLPGSMTRRLNSRVTGEAPVVAIRLRLTSLVAPSAANSAKIHTQFPSANRIVSTRSGSQTSTRIFGRFGPSSISSPTLMSWNCGRISSALCMSRPNRFSTQS
jgi:hypothetical protein